MSDRIEIVFGEVLTVLERSSAALVVEAEYAPGGEPPPAHVHPDQDEHFDLLEGSLHVEIAGSRRQHWPGDSLEIPRGTPHRMWNPGGIRARARWTTRPPGRTEQWFRALAAVPDSDRVEPGGRPKALAFAVLADEYAARSGSQCGPSQLPDWLSACSRGSPG